MTVVSTEEFNTYQDRYLDMAVNGQVYIQRGDCMFIVKRAYEDDDDDCLEPDEDLQNAVSMEEVRERLHGVIHRLFAKK
jgi:hypothetical protein